MKEKGTKVSTRPVYRTWRARLMIDDDLSTCGCHNQRFIVVEQKRAPAHCRRGDAHVRESPWQARLRSTSSGGEDGQAGHRDEPRLAPVRQETSLRSHARGASSVGTFVGIDRTLNKRREECEPPENP